MALPDLADAVRALSRVALEPEVDRVRPGAGPREAAPWFLHDDLGARRPGVLDPERQLKGGLRFRAGRRSYHQPADGINHGIPSVGRGQIDMGFQREIRSPLGRSSTQEGGPASAGRPDVLVRP